VSEPKTVATSIEEVVPGVWRWSIHDERIDFLGAAYAVKTEDGVVLIDPLPLEQAALDELGDVGAIVLTCGSHQRCAWRYRRELGADVYAPALSKEINEEPDVRYGDGDTLARWALIVHGMALMAPNHHRARDGQGKPIHHRGVSPVKGLFFL
jgi:hypothetical protein